MWLEIYLNQTATLERQADKSISPNKYGDLVYLEPVEIKCRRERVTRVYERASGDLFVSRATYYSTEELANLDKLDGYTIKLVEEYTGLEGNTIGYMYIV